MKKVLLLVISIGIVIFILLSLQYNYYQELIESEAISIRPIGQALIQLGRIIDVYLTIWFSFIIVFGYKSKKDLKVKNKIIVIINLVLFALLSILFIVDQILDAIAMTAIIYIIIIIISLIIIKLIDKKINKTNN